MSNIANILLKNFHKNYTTKIRAKVKRKDRKDFKFIMNNFDLEIPFNYYKNFIKSEKFLDIEIIQEKSREEILYSFYLDEVIKFTIKCLFFEELEVYLDNKRYLDKSNVLHYKIIICKYFKSLFKKENKIYLLNIHNLHSEINNNKFLLARMYQEIKRFRYLLD